MVDDSVSGEEKKAVTRKTPTYMKSKAVAVGRVVFLALGTIVGVSVGFLHLLLFSVQTDLLHTPSYKILLYLILTVAPLALSPNSPGVKNRVYGLTDNSLPLSMRGKKFRFLRSALRKMVYKLKGVIVMPDVIKRIFDPPGMRKTAKSTAISFCTSLYTLLTLLLIYSILIYCLFILIQRAVSCSGNRDLVCWLRRFLLLPLLAFTLLLSVALQTSLVVGAVVYARLLVDTVKFELGV